MSHTNPKQLDMGEYMELDRTIHMCQDNEYVINGDYYKCHPCDLGLVTNDLHVSCTQLYHHQFNP